ncbi:helix-turn-helix domain-containing protein [Streptomyces sp. NPDC086080]|uniref:helix-turn-helix domain-containing protein n=1 Tax=Streptomyces sp. NPDC086080 TaxID=3365748 RepID=UPI0037D5C9A1
MTRGARARLRSSGRVTLRLKGRGNSGRWRCYILVMRYADGGGLTAAGRAKSEAVCFEAAGMFEQGVRPTEVARRLRVTRKSAYAWHATWREGGGESQAAFCVSSAMTRQSGCKPSWVPALRRTAGARTSGGPSRAWPS